MEKKPQQKVPSRNFYDAAFKVKVVRQSFRDGNRKTARVFGVSECNIRRWKRTYQKLCLANPQRKSFGGPKKGRLEEIENVTVEWITEKRQKGFAITRNMIRIKALTEARNRNIPREEFKASLGWCKRLMRRQGLSLRRRTTICQKLPNEFEEKLLSYQRYIIGERRKHNYPMSAMGNADETPVFFDMVSNNTVNEIGAKTVTIKTTGNEKLRVSVMLTALADGTKLPPYMILKRKTMPKEKFPKGIFVRCQEKGWMTSSLMKDWLNIVWNKRPNARQQRAMLVLDSFRGHTTDEMKTALKRLNTDLVVIPGGMTSMLQVIDVVVNKPFKDKLKEYYNEWMINGEHFFTRNGNLKKPSIRNLCEWILQAWEQISPQSIVAGFKKCCISNALDGSEDDLLWEIEVENRSDLDSNETLSDQNSTDVEMTETLTDGDTNSSEDETVNSDCEFITIEVTDT